MNSFLDFLLSGNSLFLLLPVIITLMVQFFIYILRERRGRVSGKEKFFKSLDKKFDLELVKDRNDITILLNSIRREFESEYSLAPLLEDYLGHLTSTAIEGVDLNKLQPRYGIIKKIVEEEAEEKPFVDVPKEERRLLISLKDAIVHDDKPALEFNLHEISSLISARNRVYVRAHRFNKWSLPIAVIGVITAIIFGYMSISQKIDYEKIETINKELIEIRSNIHK